MSDVKTVWVLADERIGNVNQAVGIAEALGYPYVRKEIVYNKFAKFPNVVRGKSLMGVDLEGSSEILAPWPDIVISAGRKTAPVAFYIKKQSKNKTRLVHMMWPGKPFREFDLIAVPEHDSVKDYSNVMRTTGAPNKITLELLAKEKEKWEPKFADMPSPKIALLVGGNTKKGKFTDQHAVDLAKTISVFTENTGGSMLVSTSRRTSESATDILKNNISNNAYFYDYKSGEENPYLGFLAVSDAIIVSGDSISMCSEACATGKPVFIYCPDGLIPAKHKVFHSKLYAKSLAKPLEGHFEKWEYQPLNDTRNLVEKIKRL